MPLAERVNVRGIVQLFNKATFEIASHFAFSPKVQLQLFRANFFLRN